jgi:hypothetical protein
MEQRYTPDCHFGKILDTFATRGTAGVGIGRLCPMAVG